ncbi:MAG: hypothetical protein JWN41_1213 [Thermoleophilia bacterium]|nr:hypothetical protein [Thermoleophilia bacterium]
MRVVASSTAATPSRLSTPSTASSEFRHALADVEEARDGVLAHRFDQLPTIDAALDHVNEGIELLGDASSTDAARSQARAAVEALMGARYHIDNIDRGTTDVPVEQRLALDALAQARGWLEDIVTAPDGWVDESAGSTGPAPL